MQLIRHAPSLRRGCDIYRLAVGKVTGDRSAHRRSVCGWPFHQLPVLHIGFLCQHRWRSVTFLGEDLMIVTPLWEGLGMTTFQVAKFAEAGKGLAIAARAMGLLAPSFRTPPRVLGHNRTIRREGDVVLVSVLGRGRAWAAVLADMIEGVVRANDLTAPQADRVRDELWLRLDEVGCGVEASGVLRPGDSESSPLAEPVGESLAA